MMIALWEETYLNGLWFYFIFNLYISWFSLEIFFLSLKVSKEKFAQIHWQLIKEILIKIVN